MSDELDIEDLPYNPPTMKIVATLVCMDSKEFEVLQGRIQSIISTIKEFAESFEGQRDGMKEGSRDWIKMDGARQGALRILEAIESQLS